jgi:phosphoribosylamine--glycine ligase
MKILLVGNGARENAIAAAISQNSSAEIFNFATAKNPGISNLGAEIFTAKSLLDFENLENFAKKIKPEFAIVGPDDPIAAGAADILKNLKIPAVAPTKNLARIESSKSFARDLLDENEIAGNPRFEIFTKNNFADAEKFAESCGEIVVKFDGLAGGKGVKVQGDHFAKIADGLDFAKKCLEKSDRVVIEEKLVGEEFSAMFFCDGETLVPMPAVQDHKRALENDRGENTGGMGTISDADFSLPFLKNSDLNSAREISEKTIFALQKKCGGEKFRGIIFGGFMAVKSGVRLIEFNARFGDPEAMNIFSLLKTDFVEICRAILNSDLRNLKIEFAKKATVCKYLVPENYPENPVKNVPVEFDESKVPAGVRTFFASVDENLNLLGSRAIAFCAVENSISAAEILAEKACAAVRGKVFHRADIGTENLLKKRMENMRRVRG